MKTTLSIMKSEQWKRFTEKFGINMKKSEKHLNQNSCMQQFLELFRPSEFEFNNPQKY
jgi:hypothetical protein